LKSNDARVTRWALADLREHPQQQTLFDDLPEAQFEELAADMEANGQRDPIQILPDGTIIDGHQRRRAAGTLGWTEVDVIVRDDLTDAPEEMVEQSMIDANLHRRQIGRAIRWPEAETLDAIRWLLGSPENPRDPEATEP
jgi:ParB-like chromosome segregation protein Spo0J